MAQGTGLIEARTLQAEGKIAEALTVIKGLLKLMNSSKMVERGIPMLKSIKRSSKANPLAL